MQEHITTVDQLFRQAHLFITEGRLEEAIAVLAEVQAGDLPQRREAAYLRAWCCTLRGHWDEAAQFLLSADIREEPLSDIQALGQTERRRRAPYLLLLGNIAVDLGRYEEATHHYTQCLRFLDERRMNIASVRIKARCGLGISYDRTGFYALALTHYEEALRLCGEDNADLLEIYVGLCDAQRRLGDFAHALEYGKLALQFSIERSDAQLAIHMYTTLGRICCQRRDFHSAADYYTEALALARNANNAAVTLHTLVALADVQLEEGLLKNARQYCEQALDVIERVQDDRGLGTLYMTCGKVAEAEANAAEGERASSLLHEALSWYQKAKTVLSAIQAGPELAEVYGRLAQILEASGQQGEAIAYWKSAYSAYSGPAAASSL